MSLPEKRYEAPRISGWKQTSDLDKKAIKHFSLTNCYLRENKITEDFLEILSLLSIEDVIALKLETVSRAYGGKLIGLPLWSSLTNISREAVFKYALSASKSLLEARSFMGLSTAKFYEMRRRLDLEKYFPNYFYEKGSRSK